MEKILLINTVPTDRNGITNVIFNYYGSDLGKFYQLDYLSINTPSDSYIDAVKKNGGRNYVLNRSLKHIFRYIGSLRRIIKENHYDAVHIHGNSHTLVIELMSAFLSNCKVRIVHAHSTSSNSHFLHIVLGPLFNFLCTTRIACGIEAGKWMFGVYDFIVIKNGINTSRFAFNEENRNDIRKKMGWEGKVVLAHVGEFSANKNQEFLVEVLKKLLDKTDAYRLLLIGEGEQRIIVKEKVNELGLSEKVLFTGKISDVDKYLNACDYILMPSYYEGFPVTLIEQQANGLRCIVSDTISRDANITGNVTFLPLFVEKWVDKIYSLPNDSINNRKDRSKNSISVLKEKGFDVDSSAEKLKCIYAEAIKRS